MSASDTTLAAPFFSPQRGINSEPGRNYNRLKPKAGKEVCHVLPASALAKSSSTPWSLIRPESGAATAAVSSGRSESASGAISAVQEGTQQDRAELLPGSSWKTSVLCLSSTELHNVAHISCRLKIFKTFGQFGWPNAALNKTCNDRILCSTCPANPLSADCAKLPAKAAAPISHTRTAAATEDLRLSLNLLHHLSGCSLNAFQAF